MELPPEILISSALTYPLTLQAPEILQEVASTFPSTVMAPEMDMVSQEISDVILLAPDTFTSLYSPPVATDAPLILRSLFSMIFTSRYISFSFSFSKAPRML